MFEYTKASMEPSYKGETSKQKRHLVWKYSTYFKFDGHIIGEVKTISALIMSNLVNDKEDYIYAKV